MKVCQVIKESVVTIFLSILENLTKKLKYYNWSYSGQTDVREFKHTHTHTHTHIYIYIYIYILHKGQYTFLY